MKKFNIKSGVCGFIIGVLVVNAVPVIAELSKKNIEVTYDNIKVYKDNVLCELKDGNGDVIEPFIYNGSTYMPLRSTAQLADMQVEWNGANKSIYLWDKLVPEGTYLMDVCPPYDGQACEHYYRSEGNSFLMGGKKYSNGFTIWGGSFDPGNALINLDSKYSNVDLTVGYIDEGVYCDTSEISFFADGKLIKEVNLKKDSLPQRISLPVQYALQLKIVVSVDFADATIGFGDITIK